MVMGERNQASDSSG